MDNNIITDQLLSEKELYRIAIDNKQHHETRRDQINTYYISLFAGIIAIVPFIEQIAKVAPHGYEGYAVRCSFTALSIIGLLLSLVWELNLKRTLFYLESLDKIIMKLEAKYEQPFVTQISIDLSNKNSPDRITKYQLIIPYAFMVIFLIASVYSLLWVWYLMI